MSNKQPKTTAGQQKKAKQKSDRLGETDEEEASRLTSNEQTGASGILEAIKALKDKFRPKIDGVLTAI